MNFASQRTSTSLAVLLWLCGHASAKSTKEGSAQQPSAAAREYNSHLATGEKALDDKDWASAVEELTAARKIHKDPSLIYNICRAYDQWGHLEEARDCYQAYLQTDAQEKRATSEAYLHVVEDKLKQAQIRALAKTKLQEGALVDALAELEKAAVLGSTPELQQEIAQLRDRIRTEKKPQQEQQDLQAATQSVLAPERRISPLAFSHPRPAWRLAVGAVSLAGGVIFLSLGADALSVNSKCGPSPLCAQLYQTLGVGGGFIGTGAALLLTGIVMLAVPGHRRPAEAIAAGRLQARSD